MPVFTFTLLFFTFQGKTGQTGDRGTRGAIGATVSVFKFY